MLAALSCDSLPRRSSSCIAVFNKMFPSSDQLNDLLPRSRISCDMSLSTGARFSVTPFVELVPAPEDETRLVKQLVCGSHIAEGTRRAWPKSVGVCARE